MKGKKVAEYGKAHDIENIRDNHDALCLRVDGFKVPVRFEVSAFALYIRA